MLRKQPLRTQWQRAYWGPNYARLLAVKKRYDADGLFFVHHGVAPKTGASTGSPAFPSPEVDHTLDDGKFVGSLSRFELNELERDRPVEKTGLWRTAFGIWMRRRNAPIFG